ncbi:MAG TPA: hypothetical protein VN436_04150 [Holophaga sp.]|nr:hypothetical protein [Holophaga sp.]
MNAKELAQALNGREYDHEITNEEAAAAKAAGLVVAFGASDDLVELRGAIYEEVGACDGAEIPIDEKGLLENECGDEDCPYFEKLKERAVILKAVWHDDGQPFAWTFEAPFPHETFEIVDDGEKFCRGIVFALPTVRQKVEV